MSEPVTSTEKLLAENKDLRARLAESEQVIEAIRSGAVDAIVVSGSQGEQVYTLQGADHTYRTLIEQMGQGAATIDRDGHILYANQALCRLLNTNVSVLLGSSIYDYVEEKHRPALHAAFQTNLGDAPTVESVLAVADAANVPVQMSLVRVHVEEVVLFCVVFADLTEQIRRAEQLEEAVAERTQELRAARDYIDSMIQSMASMLVVASPDGEIVTVNEAACTALGYAEDELIGQPALLLFEEEEDSAELILSEDALPFKRTILDRLVREGSVNNIEKSLLTKAGEKTPVLVSGSVMRDHQGKIRGVVCLALDITERMRAEEARRKTESLHKMILMTAMDGFWRVDTQGRLLDVNDAYCRMSGYNREELLGMSIPDLEAQETPADTEARLRQIVAEGEARFESKHRRKDGNTFDVEVGVQYKADSGGQMVAFFRDITGRKLLEEQLRHIQKMEAVGQLAAGVAHEFNNLLFGILGSAELILATQEGELPKHLDRPLRDIKKCGRRGAALTKQLLSFARKKAPEVSRFDISQVVSDLDSVVQQVSGERIKLEIDLASDLPPVEADRGEIEQALLNLARNARDAMPDGGTLTIRTAPEQLDEARVSAHPHARPGAYAQLSVADTGCGMSPETMQRVFEPFFTTKPAGKGTGLGLSTVFADVTQNGGIIEVESRQGEGTEFHIYLPNAEEAVDAASDDAERLPDRPPGGTETILVCDDDEVVLDSAAFLLKARGYSVVRALGANEALQAVASHDGTIELLLTDVTMPDMNGWELAQKLTAQRPDMKVIFMSGYAEDVLRAGAAGGEHIEFLQKPPASDTLFRRIREVLDDAGKGS
ncbi:MAG: PAS domain S-box protein [Planctomycetes bacterium]|nr:PAS domain S-box protein [Planctomycetota bacterium]